MARIDGYTKASCEGLRLRPTIMQWTLLSLIALLLLGFVSSWTALKGAGGTILIALREEKRDEKATHIKHFPVMRPPRIC